MGPVPYQAENAAGTHPQVYCAFYFQPPRSRECNGHKKFINWNQNYWRIEGSLVFLTRLLSYDSLLYNIDYFNNIHSYINPHSTRAVAHIEPRCLFGHHHFLPQRFYQWSQATYGDFLNTIISQFYNTFTLLIYYFGWSFFSSVWHLSSINA